MSDVYIKLPKLHPSQLEVEKNPKRFKVLACGRRWGKSTVAAKILARRAMQGQTVSYMALTYKNVMEVWRLLKRLLKPAITRISEQEKFMEIAGNGIIEVWSLESPENIRSRAYDFIVIDEAAYVRDLLGIWNKTLTPMLADREGGALIMSSPRGYNDFYNFSTYEKKYPDWQTFHFPTWDNPFIPKAEIERVRAELPIEDFDQEYGAEFKSKSGLVYGTWTDDNLSEDAIYNPDLPITWGVDDGYVHGDGIGTMSYHPRVITFGQVYPDGSVTIFDEYVATLELPETTIDNALALPYAKPYVAYIDSSAQELKSRIWSRGIQTVNATHKVSDGIDLVRRYICDGNGVRLLRVHPKCVNLIYDMEHYAYEKNQLGEMKPSKLNDNCFVAGTMIETQTGKRPIEQITTDDYVLTRQGYKQVLKLHTVERQEVITITINNQWELTGTPEHKVYTANRGWQTLSDIKLCDIILVSQSIKDKESCQAVQTNKFWKSFLMELPLGAILKVRQIIATIAQMGIGQREAFTPYTARYGNSTMVRYQTDTISTILMRTLTITQLRILLASLKKSIGNIMPTLYQKNGARLQDNKLTAFDTLLVNGTEAKKGANGTGNTRSIPTSAKANRLTTFAKSVKHLTNLPNRLMPSSALTIVRAPIVGLLKRIMKTEHARYVAMGSLATSTPLQKHARVNVAVLTVKNSVAPQTVYDLTIDTVHEYFANGVLVHNCADSLRYLLYSLRYNS